MNQVLESKLKNLPDNPGVYLMKDASGQIIYVGKARVLKNRVRQYFHSSRKADKVEAMVSHIEDLDYIMTNSEMDALMLESNLIKKYKPQYNILLKDDKSYPYLRVNLKEKYPRITITRRLKKDGARYFGPYMTMSVRDVLETVQSAYPLRSCNLNMERLRKGQRACLNYHIGRCLAPCEGRVEENRYREILEQAMDFLRGNEEDVARIFRERMEDCARREEYESALLYRDRLALLDKLKLKKVAAFSKTVSLDVFAAVSNGSYSCVNMLYVRDGKMLGARNFALSDASLELSDMFRSFLVQFYDQAEIPPEILLNVELSDRDAIEELLHERAGRRVKLSCPRAGERRQLKLMAEKNAGDYLEKAIEKVKRQEDLTVGALQLLQNYLGLESLPRRMECYDISNISGTDKTASMVVFRDGEPDKSAYRRFRIKTVEGSNDFASLHEVLTRRLERAKSGDVSFAELPDLFVIDGGKGQLAYAYDAMRSTGYEIPMISLAKRDEEIYRVGIEEPIRLPKSNLALRLLQRIRDESHRFAITYHRSLRNRRFESELRSIEGIGKVKRASLLRHFKSLEALKRADRAQLMEAEGVGPELADKILAYFAAGKKTPAVLSDETAGASDRPTVNTGSDFSNEKKEGLNDIDSKGDCDD